MNVTAYDYFFIYTERVKYFTLCGTEVKVRNGFRWRPTNN